MEKSTSLWIVLILLIAGAKVNAQVTFKAEYMASSAYRDNDNNKVGDAKGSAMVYSGNIKVPISVKTTQDSLAVIWGVDLAGVYVSLNNKNFNDNKPVSDITNVQFSLFNVRPLTNQWSLIVFAGAGVYSDQKQLSKINSNSILGHGGTLFIKKINPNLDLGAGVALNNAFGFPMIFPAIYMNYDYEGTYKFKVSMLSGFQASAGYNFNNMFSLNLVTEMNGQLALLERDGKDAIFTHQYFIAGLRPEIKITKNITLPITAGLNGIRPSYYNDRSLKSIFNSRTSDSHFQFSPYVAVEINYRF